MIRLFHGVPSLVGFAGLLIGLWGSATPWFATAKVVKERYTSKKKHTFFQIIVFVRNFARATKGFPAALRAVNSNYIHANTFYFSLYAYAAAYFELRQCRKVYSAR